MVYFFSSSNFSLDPGPRNPIICRGEDGPPARIDARGGGGGAGEHVRLGRGRAAVGHDFGRKRSSGRNGLNEIAIPSKSREKISHGGRTGRGSINVRHISGRNGRNGLNGIFIKATF